MRLCSLACASRQPVSSNHHGYPQGTTFSGVAFAFATNNEAKEDIITEWPGAGSYTKQKVSARCETPVPFLARRKRLGLTQALS